MTLSSLEKTNKSSRILTWLWDHRGSPSFIQSFYPIFSFRITVPPSSVFLPLPSYAKGLLNYDILIYTYMVNSIVQLGHARLGGLSQHRINIEM